MDRRYLINDPNHLLSPSLVVFQDLVAANIDRMLEIAGGPERLRPHCKTHKTVEVVQMQMDRGVTKQKAATIAEAEMLAAAGCRDIVLAYNLVGPNIARAVAFLKTWPEIRFAATADDPRMVTELGRALQAAGLTMDLLLDVNPGRDRTGLPPGDEAAQLYQHIAATPGLEPGGFHIYDGQHHQSDFAERLEAVTKEWKCIRAMRDRLVAEGLPVPRLICGGTPTFPCYATLDAPGLELSPGTCLFHDAGYGDKFPDLTGFNPAALILTRVVSRPTTQRVTFDCGTKSVASDPPMGQRLVFPEISDAQQVLHNEEHLVIETAAADRWRVGDWTLAIPRHVCPCTALHRELYVISDGDLTGRWQVAARDRVLRV
ncbi:MAG: D-TA family PLP-dependent enzyme [Planctomycetaceae bacterium]|nr:D-TA family PLP-dependent enzyme [Planctomycetaceae bacterium]